MLIKTYLSIHNKREPFDNLGQPGHEPKTFERLPPIMEKLCELLDACTPAHEQTQVCFGDTLEVQFSPNADQLKFMKMSNELLSFRLN